MCVIQYTAWLSFVTCPYKTRDFNCQREHLYIIGYQYSRLIYVIFIGPGMILLDAEVRDKHIGMIAKSMSEWEGCIAEELELNGNNIACIKEKYKGLDLQM